jgi:hypothetical protein
MTEFQEFPKMIYHPTSGAQVIVHHADQEAEQIAAWDAELPKLSLKSAPAEAKSPAKPKAALNRKPKGAN